MHHRDKTHCPQGHEYSGANLRISKTGGRFCRKCHVVATQRYREKKRGYVLPKKPDYAKLSKEEQLKLHTKRFMSYVKKTESGCWEWTGFIPKVRNRIEGPRFMIRLDAPLVFSTGETTRWSSTSATRWCYENIKNEIIPDGEKVRHTCQNYSCVNPDHLELLGTPIERFMRFVKKQPNGCWEWQGALLGSKESFQNYGVFNSYRAHRWHYAYVNGINYNDLDPKTDFICHKCDNPPCVNPDHLYLGTPEDNMRDMAERGHTVKIHDYDSIKFERLARYLRSAIKPDLKQVLLDAVEEDLTLTCPITGQRTHINKTIAHHIEVGFAELVCQFLQQYDFKFEQIYQSRNESTEGRAFVVRKEHRKTVSKDFREFHNKHAKLQVVSFDGHKKTHRVKRLSRCVKYTRP